MTEWVSERGAAEILARDALSRTMSRRVLASGLAGQPVRTSAVSLYDATRVRSLLERPFVDVGRLPHPCGRALLDVRVAATADPADWVRIGNAGAVVRVHLRLLAEQHGFVPTVYTCCGFVLGGGEVTGALALPGTRSLLQVGQPGDWFSSFAGRRLQSGAGNPWRLWERLGPGPGQSAARIAS